MKLFILLTQDKIAWVDEEDYDRVNQYNWAADQHPNTWYASSNLGCGRNAPRIRLHRFVLKVTDPKIQVDHKDWDGLNCTKVNMRIATNKQNGANHWRHKSATGYRGVYFFRKGYIVRIRDEYGRKLHLGITTDPVEAAYWYDNAARRIQGEFAVLNFPEKDNEMA